MKYVNQIGDAQYPPPYVFPGVTILSFTLEADLAALKGLCDRLLNVGALEERGFEYRPASPFINLEILDYPRMEHGGDDPRRGAAALSMDFTNQNELYVRLFVMKWITLGGWQVPDGALAVFCPFLLVNNTWSAISGRDVMGFPKLFGAFHPSVQSFLGQLLHGGVDPYALRSDQVRQIQQALNSNVAAGITVDGAWGPQSHAALDSLRKSKGMAPAAMIDPATLSALALDPVAFPPQATVRTLAFANDDPNAKAGLLPVVTIKKLSDDLGNATAPKWPWKDILDLLQGAQRPLSADHIQLAENIMPSVQMKEFRDAENPLNACYQAILGSRIFVKEILASGSLPPVEVTITDYPNLELAAALGIPPDNPSDPLPRSATFRPVLGYYYVCDFRYDDVTTLFVNSDHGGYEPGGFWTRFWSPWLPPWGEV